MRKILIITDKGTDTLIQLDHILHLEISETGTIFFNTQYAEYALRDADFSCDGTYEGCSDAMSAIVKFYEDQESVMFWNGDLGIEPKESQCK